MKQQESNDPSTVNTSGGVHDACRMEEKVASLAPSSGMQVLSQVVSDMTWVSRSGALMTENPASWRL